jgi:hypothetical protein
VLPPQRRSLGRRFPTPQVRLVGIGHADRQAVDRDVAAFGEVVDALVRPVQIATAVHRQDMCPRHAIEGHRLDPGDGVLQHQMPAEFVCDVHGLPGIGAGAEIEEGGAIVSHDPRDLRGGFPHPVQISRLGQAVIVTAIGHADVVGRRCHRDVNAAGRQCRHSGRGIAADHRVIEGCWRGREGGHGRGRKNNAPLDVPGIEGRHVVGNPLGSRLIDIHSQKMTVAARATAERKAFGHLSGAGLQRAASP